MTTDEARAEIERLRRLTEQQADELVRLRGAETRCAWAAEVVRDAAAALDAAGVPRERDGRALALAERIAAALPPLPEPAGEWQPSHDIDGDVCRVLVEDGDSFPLVEIERDRFGDELIRIGDGPQYPTAQIERVIAGLRLALGPAGIPPTTEPKP